MMEKTANWGMQQAITIFWPDQGRIQRIYKDGSNNNNVGRINAYGYKVLRHGKTMWLAHRLLWEVSTGEKLGKMEIDHIDGDKLNNALSNLRVVTRRQNMENQHKPSKANVLGIRGVRKMYNGKFQARITTNKKPYFLGTFDTVEQAQHAYAVAAMNLHTHNPMAKDAK